MKYSEHINTIKLDWPLGKSLRVLYSDTAQVKPCRFFLFDLLFIEIVCILPRAIK